MNWAALGLPFSLPGSAAISLSALFATPFYRTTLGFEAREALGALLLERATLDNKHPDSPQSAHASVYESKFDLFHWPDLAIRSLKDRIFDHVMRYAVGTSGFTQAELAQLTFRHESWFHVTRSGGYFQPHSHPLASVSLIYCLDPGDETVADPREAGEVLFTDPRHGASMYLDPANRTMQRTFSFNGLRFRLSPDDLLIFPSYLQHCVDPYVGERPRITVAANLSFALK